MKDGVSETVLCIVEIDADVFKIKQFKTIILREVDLSFYKMYLIMFLKFS